uniref:Uncharacterized protein n=1 Tax=Timema poppense TaxID=170557 RepID=A0A7R9D6T9_TIMPO|nr:unnamed protein product [Timema poppensis]
MVVTRRMFWDDCHSTHVLRWLSLDACSEMVVTLVRSKMLVTQQISWNGCHLTHVLEWLSPDTCFGMVVTLSSYVWSSNYNNASVVDLCCDWKQFRGTDTSPYSFANPRILLAHPDKVLPGLCPAQVSETMAASNNGHLPNTLDEGEDKPMLIVKRSGDGPGITALINRQLQVGFGVCPREAAAAATCLELQVKTGRRVCLGSGIITVLPGHASVVTWSKAAAGKLRSAVRVVTFSRPKRLASWQDRGGRPRDARMKQRFGQTAGSTVVRSDPGSALFIEKSRGMKKKYKVIA